MGRKRIDIIGQRFGRLVVLSFSETHQKRNGHKITMCNCICDCGNTTIVRAKHLKNGNTTSCGCKCVERMSKMVGPLNPMFGRSGRAHHSYKEEIGEEERQTAIFQRKSYEAKKWRTSVYVRDDYTCQCCKIKGVRLVAHHMNGFSKFPEQRFLLENGLTMCEACHDELHRIMGGKNKSCTRQECETILKEMRK